MATIVENKNIKIVRYNNEESIDISIVDKKDDNEIMLLQKDIKFLMNSIINFMLDD